MPDLTGDHHFVGVEDGVAFFLEFGHFRKSLLRLLSLLLLVDLREQFRDPDLLLLDAFLLVDLPDVVDRELRLRVLSVEEHCSFLQRSTDPFYQRRLLSQEVDLALVESDATELNALLLDTSSSS